MRNALATVGQMFVAVMVAVIVAVVSLSAISRVQWPAFPSSNQLHALTTVGQVGCLAGLVAVGWVWRHGRERRRYRILAQLGGLVFVSAFSVVTLGMPLGATKLYLFGISVDQQFRTEYLTRLADSPALHDMTYFGLPTFYPPGWFWIGGRVAALNGTPAWEVCKPWAITSITIAVAVALVLWWRMIRFEYALIVTTATAAVTLAYSSPEPYAAIITVLLPPVLVLTWSGLRAGDRPGAPRRAGWAAVIGAGLFLGFAATWYTLLFGFSAFTMLLMALALAAARWRGDGFKAALDPLRRLAVVAVIAAAIASTTWLPFFLRAARNPISNTGSAQHYLPADGAELTFPMLQFSLLGAICMIGTLWLVVRARTSVRAGALAIGVLAVYLWSLLSMLTTLARTTLLSFRLQPTLTVLLVAAGAFGFLEATLAIRERSRAVVPVAGAIGVAAAIAFSQDIPDVLRPDLTIAYTDTDGHGQRGDRRPPSSEKFYSAIDATILQGHRQAARSDRGDDRRLQLSVLLPVLGVPGADVALRQSAGTVRPARGTDREVVRPQDARRVHPRVGHVALAPADGIPHAPRRRFVWEATTRCGWPEDVYPNQPNVRRYTVDMRAALFDDPHFVVESIGPFVLAIRKPGA